MIRRSQLTMKAPGTPSGRPGRARRIGIPRQEPGNEKEEGFQVNAFQKFRSDLHAFDQRDGDGRKFVVLKDPVSQQFFRLTDYEYRLLSSLDGTLPIDKAVGRLEAVGYSYSEDDVKAIVGKAAGAGLLLGTGFGTAAFQLNLKERILRARRDRRLSSIYFLFIPVLNPDRFLEKTLWLFKLLCNRWTAVLWALTVPGAVYLVVSGIPKIERELLFFFNLTNLPYLWVTIALTKLAHEFAHAYTAKRFGLHVPQMGIAFLIFFPCLYCDTTDAWQLADRRQRMAISGAGVIAEAVLAVFAAYVWYFSKPGIINSTAFYLMGVALVSTLLFNGNPLLKFDGYFIFSDYLRMPNLYQKSFAHIRHVFMNRILGIATYSRIADKPGENVAFTAYGIASFVYRIVLYLGITAGVYYRFDKTIGLILAVLAFGLFVARPVLRGTASLWRHRTAIRPRPVPGLLFCGLLAIGLGLLLVPIPRHSVYPCYLDADRKQKLTVPLHTWVKEVHVREGSAVTGGAVLFRLDTSLLELRLAKRETDRDILRKELDLILLDERTRAEAPSKEIELLQAHDEIDDIKRDLDLAGNGCRAPFSGTVTWLDTRMKPGYQPGEGAVVGRLESVTDCRVHALIPEDDLEKVKPGRTVRVWFPIDGGLELEKKILELKPFSERDLSESPFSSRVGGELATEVKDRHQKDVPLEAQYDCSIGFPNDGLRIPLGMTGRLVAASPPKSIAAMVIDGMARTFNRESIF
ncbi:MAG: site-2 protease family protein [Pseudomonadota bacterium]